MTIQFCNNCSIYRHFQIRSCVANLQTFKAYYMNIQAFFEHSIWQQNWLRNVSHLWFSAMNVLWFYHSTKKDGIRKKKRRLKMHLGSRPIGYEREWKGIVSSCFPVVFPPLSSFTIHWLGEGGGGVVGGMCLCHISWHHNTLTRLQGVHIDRSTKGDQHQGWPKTSWSSFSRFKYIFSPKGCTPWSSIS